MRCAVGPVDTAAPLAPPVQDVNPTSCRGSEFASVSRAVDQADFSTKRRENLGFLVSFESEIRR